MDGVEVVGLETACEALKHCLQRAPPVTYRHPQLSIYCEVYTPYVLLSMRRLLSKRGSCHSSTYTFYNQPSKYRHTTYRHICGSVLSLSFIFTHPPKAKKMKKNKQPQDAL